MLKKQNIKILLLAGLILISLGGWLLHLRFHPLSSNISFSVPLAAGILSVVAVPLLFGFKKTISYGYVLNGIIVIIGTITMAHYSLAFLPQRLSVPYLVLNTTFPDIAIL